MSFLFNQFDRLRRRWYVVIAVMAVFVFVAFISTLGQKTSYSAKAALSTTSAAGENTPYALSLAYIYLFNDPSFQDGLLRKGRVPAGVTAVAQPATVGTIFYIETTGASAKEAKAAANALASVFRDEINGALAEARQKTVDAVQQPFVDGGTKRAVIPAEDRIAMQDQINTINANTNGTVNPVGLDSAVLASTPSNRSLLGIAAAGGLFAGVLAALAWEVMSRRIRTGYDVEGKAGISPVALVAGSGSGAGIERSNDLRHLANRLTSGAAGSRHVIALVPAQAGARPAVHELGGTLAATLGAAGSPALLVRTDATSTSMWSGEEPIGFVDALADATIPLDDIASARGEGFSVIEPGNRAIDPGAAVSRARVAAFLDAARKSADVVVIEVPVLADSPEGQVICAQADQTVIVVDPETATVPEVRDSRRLLDEVHAAVGMAVVMASTPIASHHRIDHGVEIAPAASSTEPMSDVSPEVAPLDDEPPADERPVDGPSDAIDSGDSDLDEQEAPAEDPDAHDSAPATSPEESESATAVEGSSEEAAAAGRDHLVSLSKNP